MSYLQHKKSTNSFSDGAFHLLKISESAFEDFVYDYENSNSFKKVVDDLHLSEMRDIKINDLFDETDRGIGDK